MSDQPRSLRDLLGTPAGDRWLANPSSANDLYQHLVGGADHQKGITPPQSGGSSSPHLKQSHFSDDTPVTYTPPSNVSAKAVFVQSERAETVYSSRDHNPGIGYPSCSRALARRPKSFRDNNGYYRHIGVLPTATMQEIRTKLRTLYRRCHPDTGWSPDPAEFRYLREIARVLLNEKRRERYDNMDPGEKWMDSRVRAEVEEHMEPIVMGDGHYTNPLDDPTVRGAFRRVDLDEETVNTLADEGGPLRADRRQAMREQAAKNGYDFWAEHMQAGDFELAQDWYEALVAAAPLVGYTRAIRVWLTDKPHEWLPTGGILKINRSWPANTATAFALFCVHVGVS